MDRKRAIYTTTIIGAIGNVLLLAFKFGAGIVGHSGAMIADAVHSLSDFVTDVIVLLFVKISGRPKDADHQYGHGKYETLATAIIGVMLIGVGFGILWKGASDILRCIRGEELEAPGMLALIAALVSIAVKEGLYQYTIRMAKKIKSQVMVANAWHHRSDALSSIAAAIGIGGAILLGAKWRVLDPVAAVLVSVLIIRAAVELIGPSINELLDKALPQETEEKILQIVSAFPGVEQPHNLRTRRIGPVSSVELHLRVDGNMTVFASHAITKEIEGAIRDYLGPETLITLHVEPLKLTSNKSNPI